ncbi:MAG: inorganic phosphate transporter [Candidatus Hadarchaeales archaeon]
MIELTALAVLLASFYIAWNIGANDAANAIGTAVGGRVLSFRRAVSIAMLFVLLGAALEGYKLMKPVGEQIVTGVDPSVSPFSILPWAAAIALLCAGLVVTLQTRLGFPISTHQAIIGALAGAGVAIGTFSNVTAHVNWWKLLIILWSWVLTPLAAAFFAFVLYRVFEVPLKRVKAPEKLNLIFAAAVIASGCYVAYVIGANGVGTAMGMAYAVGCGGGTSSSVQLLALLGGVGVFIGSLTYSRRVIQTVGAEITSLGPMSAFVAQFGAALTIHLFTQWGLPVSTSHAIVGGVVGAGLVGGIAAISRRRLGEIVIAWIATPIASMFLAFCLASVIIVV